MSTPTNTNTNLNLFDTLNARGYINQSTDMTATKALLNSTTPTTFYLGVDPTADSLHIGHFFAFMLFRYLQDAGHHGILVFGGATAMIGDPSGKSDMRKMMSANQVKSNIDKIVDLASRFIITTGKNKATVLNNADWMRGYDYVAFMRDIGVHFNVSKMLASDAYAKRLEIGGLSFLEMGYMLMQAYDFAHLADKYNCRIQIGGSDQWGNIVAGTTLYRKLKYGELEPNTNNIYDNIYGLTCPLLLTKDGHKMGKTEKGTLWVDANRTTPYDFYQYFYNIDDKEIEQLLKLFTKIPLDEINATIKADIVKAKKLMAYEITKLVHGVQEADKVLDAVSALFNPNNTNLQSDNIPTIQINKSKLIQGINAIDLFVETGLVATKSQCRQLIDGGGIIIDNNKITNYTTMITQESITNNTSLLKKGKKNYIKVEWV